MGFARGILCLIGAGAGVLMTADRFNSRAADRSREVENLEHHAIEADMMHHATDYTGNDMFTNIARNFKSHQWFMGLRRSWLGFKMGFQDLVLDNLAPIALTGISLSVGFPRFMGGAASAIGTTATGFGSMIGSVARTLFGGWTGAGLGSAFRAIGRGIAGMGPTGAVIAVLTAGIGYLFMKRLGGEFNHRNQTEYFNPFLPDGEH
jgi:hypothetical protein